jgi:hypothetical protein
VGIDVTVKVIPLTPFPHIESRSHDVLTRSFAGAVIASRYSLAQISNLNSGLGIAVTQKLSFSEASNKSSPGNPHTTAGKNDMLGVTRGINGHPGNFVCIAKWIETLFGGRCDMLVVRVYPVTFFNILPQNDLTSLTMLTTNFPDMGSGEDHQKGFKSHDKFSADEDEQLRSAVSRLGTQDWMAIANCIPGKSLRQCKDRWTNYLMPCLNTESWTEEDDSRLLQCQASLGNKWVKIARFFVNRTDAMIKNRFEQLQRKANKRKRRARKAAAQAETGTPPAKLSVDWPMETNDGQLWEYTWESNFRGGDDWAVLEALMGEDC